MNNLIERVQEFYWSLIPYESRPFHLWYRFKCFVWHRYTTVKPRYLGHVYCDTRELLVHTSFELLIRFYEEEFDQVKWYGDFAPKVGDRYVADIIKYLIDWYENDWVPYYNYEFQSLLHDEQPEPVSWFKTKDGRTLLSPVFKSKEDEEKSNQIHKAIRGYEESMERQAEENLKLLAEIRPYLWT